MNPEDINLHLVENFEDASAMMRWLGERRPVMAVDTETGGLEWWHHRLRLVQIGDAQTGWAIPWEDWAGLVKEAIGRYEGPIVMHNAKFDMRFLERNGVKVKRSNVDDTRVMAHLLNPLAPTGLKPLGVSHVHPSLAAGQDDLKRSMAQYRWTWDTVPVDLPSYWIYSALDVVITSHLWEKFLPQVEALGCRGVYELELASTQVIMDMETRGCRIDVDYCEKQYDSLTAYVEQMARWIKDEFGCGVSDRNVAARLLKDGVRLTERTDSGQWSVAKEVLEGIDHPLAHATLDRRAAQKLASAYFRNILNLRDGDILHPDVNPLGARTGRMSISRPSMQNMTSGRIVRDAFIPREGNKLIDQDYDQVEQRMTAHFTRDERMIAAFVEADATGLDFFTALARMIFDDPSIIKADPRRQQTKNAAYGKVYGAGVEKFSATAGIPVAEGQRFLTRYDETFPGVRRWQKEIEREAREHLRDEGVPYVVTDWGRRLPGEEDALFALANYKIQGTAADLLKQKLVDLDNAGLAQYLILPVHDELLFDVPAEDIEEVAPALLETMREPDRFAVPLTCSQDIGMTWGEIH